MAASEVDRPATTASPAVLRNGLLTSTDCRGHVHLVVGTSPLAAARCTISLAAGATPILVAPPTADLHYSLARHIESGAVAWHKLADSADIESLLLTLGREEVGGVADTVFVTPLASELQGAVAAALDPARISALCRRHRIPVNVADQPALCSFALLSTHTDGPLQIGVTTNGRGCKLASRIRREVAAALPAGLGHACERLGDVRRRVQAEDRKAAAAASTAATNEQGGNGLESRAGAPVTAPSDYELSVDDSYDQSANFNKLVLEADADAAKTRRIRWLSQVCEYWPLNRLAAITDADVDAIFCSYPGTAEPASIPHNIDIPLDAPSSALGRIILAGSGPGHPDLLTRATYRAIQSADLILADKLVPQGVLDLIPRRTPVSIARKFPGNADAAQEELLLAATAACEAGQTVLRLKQGDPFVYGRGGEEVAFFRARGLGDRVVVLPGVTSALSAPLFAGIPVTQREVADQVLICTGTGRKGKPPAPPGYTPSRTAVFLMGLHRIADLVTELTSHLPTEAAVKDVRQRTLWPLDTPCAVVERASCPDQKVIRTTLERVVEAIEAEGSRPPGLLVVGRACEVLYTPGKGQGWAVEDGFKGLDLDDASTLGMAALA